MARGDDEPFEHYLNVETGELVTIPRDSESLYFEVGIDEDEIRAERAIVDDAPTGRWLRVPSGDGRDRYRMMERFADSLPDPDDRDEVRRAITGKGAFRRFRDALGRLRLVDRWYAFEAAAMLQEARDWLEMNGIEAPPSSRKPPQPPAVVVAQPEIELLDLVLLGGTDDETRIDGRVHRRVRADSADKARALFRALARSLCAYVGEPWRRHFVDGKTTTFKRDRFTLSIDGSVVELSIAVDDATWQRFRN